MKTIESHVARTLFLGMLSLFLAAAGNGVHALQMAAVVVKIDGEVQLKQGDAPAQAAAVGARLSLGDELHPATGSSATILRKTGATQVITTNTVIEAPADATEGDMFSRTVNVLVQAASTDARSQPNRQGMIRPIPGEPVLVAPRNQLKVLTLRPTFTWMSVEGADGYTIQIRRDGGPPLRYQAGRVTTWTLPPDVPALIPGESYWWTIAPSGSGRATREQRFEVIGPADFGEVATNLRRIRDMDLQPESDGLFLTAIVYRDAGLYYDAAAALEALQGTGASLSAEVYLLQGEILDAVGNLEAARAAFDRADGMNR